MIFIHSIKNTEITFTILDKDNYNNVIFTSDEKSLEFDSSDPAITSYAQFNYKWKQLEIGKSYICDDRVVPRTIFSYEMNYISNCRRI